MAIESKKLQMQWLHYFSNSDIKSNHHQLAVEKFGSGSYIWEATVRHLRNSQKLDTHQIYHTKIAIELILANFFDVGSSRVFYNSTNFWKFISVCSSWLVRSAWRTNLFTTEHIELNAQVRGSYLYQIWVCFTIALTFENLALLQKFLKVCYLPNLLYQNLLYQFYYTKWRFVFECCSRNNEEIINYMKGHSKVRGWYHQIWVCSWLISSSAIHGIIYIYTYIYTYI